MKFGSTGGSGGGGGGGSSLPRVVTLTPVGGVFTPDGKTTDIAIVNQPSGTFTIAMPTDIPGDGYKLKFRITTGGTAPTWNSGYISSGSAALPTGLMPNGQIVTVQCEYNLLKNKMVALACDLSGY